MKLEESIDSLSLSFYSWNLKCLSNWRHEVESRDSWETSFPPPSPPPLSQRRPGSPQRTPHSKAGVEWEHRRLCPQPPWEAGLLLFCPFLGSGLFPLPSEALRVQAGQGGCRAKGWGSHAGASGKEDGRLVFPWVAQGFGCQAQKMQTIAIKKYRGYKIVGVYFVAWKILAPIVGICGGGLIILHVGEWQ